ncbi:MAG: hypothetical protein IPN20_04550 [Haliscomenobacter sp.]|nr:hypothetical protein [Haliscomenobacter sp.]
MSFIKLPNGSYIRIDQITAVRALPAIDDDDNDITFPDRVIVEGINNKYERCDCASAEDAERLAAWIVSKIS